MLQGILVVSGVGLAAGVLLVIASKFMFVPVDETAEKIRACLPGANCGACGYAGCDGYADALSKRDGAVIRVLSSLTSAPLAAKPPPRAFARCWASPLRG